MSDDFRRRRRLRNTGSPSPRRSNGSGGMNPWVVTIFAAIVVIAGGWFLGQAIARVFNGPPKGETVAQAPTPLPIVTPPPSPSAQPTEEPTAAPTEKPTPTRAPSVAPEPSPTATVKVIVAPTATPTAAPSPAASPTAPSTPSATDKPSEAPTRAATQAPAGESPAAHIVRAYIDALRRGDPGTASNYLGNGSPDEAFIDSATRISSIASTRNNDGSYKVEVDMHTGKGEYYETFTVASDRILEKTAIKP